MSAELAEMTMTSEVTGHVVGGDPAAVNAANAIMAGAPGFTTPEVSGPTVGEMTAMVNAQKANGVYTGRS